ncbi:Potassium ion/proton antiporter [Schizosaccharomyces pombe]
MSTQSIFDGDNVVVYSASDPLLLFIVQAIIIIALCRLIHIPLSFLQQPRVIAEIIGGIVLGPTVMGRIPKFLDYIFPTSSMGPLNLVSNLGLVLFLFVIGMEVDLRVLVLNYKVTLLVTVFSIVIPFGAGAGISAGLYKFTTREFEFGKFLLFISTAMSITAFPVLARILSELHLLHKRVGVIVLSAGIGNDVIGWILLALSVTLVNSGSGVRAVYILLLALGWCLFLFIAIKPLVYLLAVKTRSLKDKPSESFICIVLSMVLVSAFFTDIIGIHPIFGGFLVGTIIPHENDLTVKITEKIEDLVNCLFLPLYFASSGLKTNISTLNTGKIWGYTIGTICVAIASKMGSSMLAARILKMPWSDSLVVGSLMSCKGLVELIVLNIGLSTGILDETIFSMFVFMAVITTFVTTPMTKFFLRFTKSEHDDNSIESSEELVQYLPELPTRLSFLINHPLDASAAMIFIQHIYENRDKVSGCLHLPQIIIHSIWTLFVDSRTSNLLRASQVDNKVENEALMGLFETFVKIKKFEYESNALLVSGTGYYNVVLETLKKSSSNILIMPYLKDYKTIENESSSSPLSLSSIRLALGDSFKSLDELIPLIKMARIPVGVFFTRNPHNLSVKKIRPIIRSTEYGSPKNNFEQLEKDKKSFDQVEISVKEKGSTYERSKVVILIYLGTENDLIALELLLKFLYEETSIAYIYTYDEFYKDDSATSLPNVVYTSEVLLSKHNDSAFKVWPKLRKNIRKITKPNGFTTNQHSQTFIPSQTHTKLDLRLSDVTDSVRSRINVVKFGNLNSLLSCLHELIQPATLTPSFETEKSITMFLGCRDKQAVSEKLEVAALSEMKKLGYIESSSEFGMLAGLIPLVLLSNFPLIDFFLGKAPTKMVQGY